MAMTLDDQDPIRYIRTVVEELESKFREAEENGEEAMTLTSNVKARFRECVRLAMLEVYKLESEQ